MLIGDFEDFSTICLCLTAHTLQSSVSGSLLARVLAHISSILRTAYIGISMGGNEGAGRGQDRWNFFGMRPSVQKSPTDPGSDSNPFGGFSLQSYFGLQKSTTLDGIKTQENLTVENPANIKSPKVEVMDGEGQKPAPHKLKHRDMNILTPSGF